MAKKPGQGTGPYIGTLPGSNPGGLGNVTAGQLAAAGWGKQPPQWLALGQGVTVTPGTGPGGVGGISGTITPGNDPFGYLAAIQKAQQATISGSSGSGLSASALGLIGLPPDIESEVNRILASTTDPNQAIQLALAYVRGTPWYQNTYPGIQAGLQYGIFSDEAGYRAALNDANQYYRRYVGRDISAGEFASYLQKGWNATMIGQHLAGWAYINAYGNDLRYVTGAFDTKKATEGELSSYGDQLFGLGNTIGQALQRRIDLANKAYQGVFQGTAGGIGQTIGKQGVNAPALAAARGQFADVPA